MQLDAEEDEHVFYKPPVEPTARPSDERLSGETAAPSTATTMASEDDD
jgi:sorting nexin-1/2